MGRPGRVRRGCLWALLALAVVMALILVSGYEYVGCAAFPDVEYRLTFTDRGGRPVPGVTLRVLTQADGVSHFYPVDEFLPDAPPPTSDADGRMVFHHAHASIEFDLRFGPFDLWVSGRPEYDCVFLLGDREVHRVRFHKLNEKGTGTVRRQWEFPDPNSERYGRREGEDTEAWQLRMFDGNRDGRLDREEIIAEGHVLDGSHGRKREINFAVVERTIVVAGR